MRQSASIEPFTPSPETQVPHPVLRAALDNLDVQLEEELIRYRRQQRLQLDPVKQRKFQPQAFNSRLPARPARDGVQLPKVRDTFNLEATGEFPVGNSADRENPVKAILGEPLSASGSLPISPLSPPWQPSLQIPLVEAAPEPPASGIVSYAQQPELSAHSPNAMLHKLAQQNDPGYPQPVAAPEDYLESSEELLKSIEEEGSSLRAQRRSDLLDTLLTPLGIGSMLLLLLSSASLGYVMMNPSVLSVLFAPAPPSSAAASPASSPLTRVPTTPIGIAPPSPNLAAEEFPDLSVDTLSKAKPSTQRAIAVPTPTKPSAVPPIRQSPARTPVESYRSDAAPAEVQQPLPPVAVQSAPPVEPAPVYSSAPEPIVEPPRAESARPEPPRTEAPISRPPEVAARPIPENLYYVGTDYSGDPSLQQARAAVPDAYVRNLPSGAAKVQLGAFTSEAAAQARVQELQQQGIAAQVYQP